MQPSLSDPGGGPRPRDDPSGRCLRRVSRQAADRSSAPPWPPKLRHRVSRSPPPHAGASDVYAPCLPRLVRAALDCRDLDVARQLLSSDRFAKPLRSPRLNGGGSGYRGGPTQLPRSRRVILHRLHRVGALRAHPRARVRSPRSRSMSAEALATPRSTRGPCDSPRSLQFSRRWACPRGDRRPHRPRNRNGLNASRWLSKRRDSGQVRHTVTTTLPAA